MIEGTQQKARGLAASNGGALSAEKAKRTRTTRPASVRTIGMKVADLLERLPPEQRQAAISVANVLLNPMQHVTAPAIGG